MRTAFASFLLFAAPALADIPPAVTNTPRTSNLASGTSFTSHAAASPDRRFVGMTANIQKTVLDSFTTIIYTGNPFAGIAPNNGNGGLINILNAPVIRTNQILVTGTSDAQLKKPIAALKADSISLADAATKIAQTAKTTVTLNLDALKASKVDLAAAHTLDLPAGDVEQALVMLLARDAAIPMVIQGNPDSITITTRDAIDTKVLTKVYPLERMADYLKTLAPDDASLKSMASTDLRTKSTDSPAVHAVTKYIRPEIWKSAGGKTGEITQSGKFLTITAPASVHLQLEIVGELDPTPAPKQRSSLDPRSTPLLLAAGAAALLISTGLLLARRRNP